MESTTIGLIFLILVGLLILAAIIIGIVVGLRRPSPGIHLTALSYTQTPWDAQDGGNYVANNPMQPQGPDFVVSATTAAETLYLQTHTFSVNDCAVVEGLIDSPGTKKLLRFTTRIINIGNAAIVFGDPSGNPAFELSPCHGHYHFHGFSEYQLRDATATVLIAAGHKQAYCLRDDVRVFSSVDSIPSPTSSQYNCENQGLSIGWADDYGHHLDGQWIDVTNVPPGTYTLRILVNTPVVIPEEIKTNNNFVDIVFALE